MPSHLCLSIRLLDTAFHGRANGEEREWPPSPLRLFQALVAGAAARWGMSARFDDYAVSSLRWLESLDAPLVIAPVAITGSLLRLYVPSNSMEKVAAAWRQGKEGSIAHYRTEKDFRPTHLPDGSAVHYVWELGDAGRAACEAHRETLFAAARSVVALGWGIDMAVGNGALLDRQELVDALPGQRWRPVVESSGLRLRVPVPGTLDALLKRHEAFLNRLPPSGGFVPVPPLAEFRSVGYRCDSDRSPRPFAAFEIRKSVEELSTQNAGRSVFRPYDPVRWTPTVAGMVRHAAGVSAMQAGWSKERVNTFVLGHTRDGKAQARGDDAESRFAYLPLPSIEYRGEGGQARHVGMIRRLLVVGPVDGAKEIAWLKRTLNGQELFAEYRDDPVAMLSILSEKDTQLMPYLNEHKIWTTVTPVIFPGHDDRRRSKAEKLLRIALAQAGFPKKLCDEAKLDWRHVGYRTGLRLAKDYHVKSQHESLPRHHVRIEWAEPVPGPICLGTGRHYGVGLFAGEA